MSPDGLYYWDGTAWQSVTGAPHRRAIARGPTLEPTSWTRPLQVAVVALYAALALFAASVPIWFIATMTQWANNMNERFGANPSPTPDVQSTNDAMTVGLYVLVIIAIALAAVAIVSALKRRPWAHYAIAILLGLQVLAALGGLLEVLVPSLIIGAALPLPVVLPELAFTLIGGALLVWMILAAATRGPWGMRRVS